ncbi:TIM barrel protein [Marispirochaeta sp.]|jgi:sugar phosphate isomerase/epimerase|uniref:sugar phosphate isomerase/epimerase family protein n=1 Tax=Marispirochaeta sp. TaxID=2038653 RepID=UPI0029C6B10D|nr:TIM barrel protein [Marispirochaeta sp.]
MDIKRPFRLSSVLTGFFPESVNKLETLLDGIALSAEMGFDTVEFFYDGPETDQVRKALDLHGMASIFLASYGMKTRRLDPGHPDRTEGGRVFDLIQEWINKARECGSPRVMIVSGPECQEPREREKCLRRTRALIHALCDYGAQGSEPVQISLEPFNNTGEPSLLLGPTYRSTAMAESLSADCVNFSLTIDLSHLLQLREDPQKSVDEAARYCSHIHLANCVIRDPGHPLFGDKHPPFGVPEGEVDKEFLTAFLKKILMNKVLLNHPSPLTIGLEVITRGAEDPAEVMAEAKRTFDTVYNSSIRTGAG